MENHFVVGFFHSSQNADFPIIVCLVTCESAEEKDIVIERMRQHSTFFQAGGRGRAASAILELKEKPVFLEVGRINEFDFKSFMKAWDFTDYPIAVIEQNQPKERPEN